MPGHAIANRFRQQHCPCPVKVEQINKDTDWLCGHKKYSPGNMSYPLICSLSFLFPCQSSSFLLCFPLPTFFVHFHYGWATLNSLLFQYNSSSSPLLPRPMTNSSCQSGRKAPRKLFLTFIRSMYPGTTS